MICNAYAYEITTIIGEESGDEKPDFFLVKHIGFSYYKRVVINYFYFCVTIQ